MGHTRTLVLFAGAALGLGATVASAQNSLDQSRAYQSELSADAAGRTSLLSTAQPTGHDDKGFFMADGTGNNRLNVGGLEQFRYMANWRSSSGAAPEHAFAGGFQNRRTQLWFNGNIINPDLTFKVQMEFSRSSGTAILLDSWGAYKLENGWSVKWGQYKLPLLREELIADQYQLAAERSIANSVFSQTRSQGVELNYQAEAWRVYLDFSDGLGTLNTDFDVAGQADWAFTGRVEWKWAGDWKQFHQFTSWQSAEYGGMLGGAGHYQHGGGTGVTTGVNIAEYTLDASVVGNGWNAFVAGIGRHTKATGGGGGPSTDDFGAVLQGGIFVTSKDELFGRYDGVFPDSNFSPLDKKFHTITAGWNHYFAENSQAARFTADVQWNLNRQSENALISPNTATGVLSDTKSNQVALRLQFQLLF